MHAVHCVKCGEEIDIHQYLAETAGNWPPSCEKDRQEVQLEASFSRPKFPADWHGGARLDRYGRWIVEIELDTNVHTSDW